jgi:hypothetical protein
VTLLRLTGVAAGLGPAADVAALDEAVARAAIARELDTPRSPVAGRSAEELLEALAPRVGPERLLDLLLRAGPYGDAFGARAEGGLSLDALEAAPHGVDLGALTPRLPDMLRTRSGMIELTPAPILADLPRLRQTLSRGAGAGDGDGDGDGDGSGAGNGPVLVGRRQLRSNNSWMHNLPMLVRGRSACTLHVHPQDAARYGLIDGEAAELRTRTGVVTAEVEVTDAVMPGVVSLPHGWGHDGETRMSVAAAHAGTNSNVLADELLIDAVSGNAVLNGIPVALAPAPAAVPADGATAATAT